MGVFFSLSHTPFSFLLLLLLFLKKKRTLSFFFSRLDLLPLPLPLPYFPISFSFSRISRAISLFPSPSSLPFWLDLSLSSLSFLPFPFLSLPATAPILSSSPLFSASLLLLSSSPPFTQVAPFARLCLILFVPLKPPRLLLSSPFSPAQSPRDIISFFPFFFSPSSSPFSPDSPASFSPTSSLLLSLLLFCPLVFFLLLLRDSSSSHRIEREREMVGKKKQGRIAGG